MLYLLMKGQSQKRVTALEKVQLHMEYQWYRHS